MTAAVAESVAPNRRIVITALGHQDYFSADWNSDAAQAVRDAAAEISDRLGWRAPISSQTYRTRQ